MSRGARIAAWSVAAVVAILHLLIAGKYDFFRNELYFIVCGRHPAFGYVDQPPLAPLLSALTQFGGEHLWLLRLPGVVAAVLVIPLTVALAQLLGAGTRGAWLAAVAAASSPLVTATSATFNTSSFEPLTFTAVAYFVTRALARNEPRAYWWAGLIGGLSFETRYGILLWAAALVVGLALAGPRGVFRSSDAWIGLGIAVLVALPNAVWQIAHGLPFLEVVRNDSAGNLIGTPASYVMVQTFANNFLLAPLWIAGIVGPFVLARAKAYRFLALTFVAMLVLVFATHGKMYYTAGAYPAIFALGAAACTGWPRVLVGIWAALAAANGSLALPFVLPIDRPSFLARLVSQSNFHPPPIEAAAIGAPLMEPFSDEFGWRGLARTVEGVYGALSAADRAKAAIFAENYGEAGAIDFYGRDLPPALSGNNQYFLWGPRGYDGSVVIAVNVDPAQWSRFCNSAKVVARFGTSRYAMPYEQNRPIVLCRGMHPPLPQLWPQFKNYGITNLRS
jgi:hypothetical protein